MFKSKIKLLLCLLFIISNLSIFANASSCSNHCVDCDPSGNICYACEAGYEMSVIGKCVSDQIISKCVIYSPSNTCFACQPSFSLVNGKCIKIYSGCISTNPADNSCLTCDFGTVLTGGSCKGSINCINSSNPCQKCIDGFSLSNNICVDNTAGCLTVNKTSGLCVACKDGYNLIGYECIQKSIVSYDCYIYNKKGQCQICKNGFILTDTYCLLPQQIQDLNDNYTTIQQIQKQNQIRYALIYPIINSANLSQNFSNQTTTVLVNISILHCQVVDPTNSSSCLVCLYSYYPSAGQCLAVSQYCNGFDITNGNCFACYFGLTLNSGKCRDNNCITYDTSNNCQQCNSLYQLNDSKVCQYADGNCQQIINNRCNQCKSGYYVTLNGTCKILPNGCQFANIVTGDCLQCLDGYSISNNKCFLSFVIQNCNVTDSINKVCTSCNYGYFWTISKICQKVSDLCTGYNIQNGQCLACIDGFRLNSTTGQCMDLNCLQYNQNSTCLKCNSFYTLDKTSKNISDGFCKLVDKNCATINSNLIACAKCNSGYYINVQNYCQVLPLNCQGAAPNGSCLTCASGYSLKGNICANTTQTSSSTQNQMTSLTNTTTNVTLNANTSSIDPNCLNYSLPLDKCLNCSNRYYVGTTGKCFPVNPLCQNYSVNGACTSCYQGYILDIGLCGIAASSDPYCSNTTSDGTCLSCYSGFFLKAVRGCVPINPLCKSSDSQTGLCLSCFQGYQLSNGSCSIFLKDPNCQFYDSNNVCANCSINYYLDQTTGKCKQVSSLCKSYNSTNGNCIDCYPGYTLSAGTCIIANSKTSDINCQKSTNGVCTQCYGGFYLSNNFCKKINLICQTFDKTNGNCTSCYQGYTLSNGDCKISNSQLGVDVNCKTFNTTLNLCGQCYKGYFIDLNGVCQIFDPLCAKNNQTNGKCLTCYPGYTLINQTCQITNPVNSSLNSDPFCIKVQGLNCLQCNNGYFLPKDTGICTLVDPLCKNYSNSSGLCTQCYTGYSLNNGKCYVGQLKYTPFCNSTKANGECDQCLDRYYLTTNASCESVSILCGQYNPFTGNCYTCIPGYVLQLSECIYPSFGVDPGCSFYTNSYCTKCLAGYYLTNFRCALVDSNCVSFDQTKGVCQSCSGAYTIQGANCV